MPGDCMQEILQSILEFNRERDWEQFHSPVNLAKSISIEAGELLECFQWSDEYTQAEVEEEIADVMMYCLMFCEKTGIDPEKAMLKKLEKNRTKYPVEKARGNSKKYTELGDE